MAVDLFDLVESIKREVNPPGYNLFPAATDEMWAGYLEDAFWKARLAGLLEGYTLAEGQILPMSGSTDVGRDWQAIIVLFAAITIVANELRRMNTSFRAKAGPVEFETQNSATVLREQLADLKAQYLLVLKRLGDVGEITDSYIDSVAERTTSLDYGDSTWVL